MKRRRPRGDRDGVIHSDPVRETTLESLEHRPERQAPGMQDLEDELLFTRTEVGPREGNRIRAGRHSRFWGFGDAMAYLISQAFARGRSTVCGALRVFLGCRRVRIALSRLERILQRIHQRLPGRLDDVLRDADRSP